MSATLCLDVGGTAVKAAVVHGGEVLADRTIALSPAEPALETARRAGEAVLAHADVGAPTAVGIAVPGIVERGRLAAAYGKLDDLRDVDLATWSVTAFGASAAVENDARAALVGESTVGVAAGVRDAALVALGTGIGTAALLDGELVAGAHGHGGILAGHLTVDLDGPECLCGNVGCAEAVASTWALARDRPEFDGIAGLVAAADAGDADAAELLARCTKVWGAVVVGLCHTVDPEVVVVTGGVLGAGETVLGPIRAHVERHLWRSLPRPALLVPERPDLSVALGLAVLAETGGAGTGDVR